jgi:hypothetical protein
LGRSDEGLQGAVSKDLSTFPERTILEIASNIRISSVVPPFPNLRLGRLYLLLTCGGVTASHRRYIDVFIVLKVIM